MLRPDYNNLQLIMKSLSSLGSRHILASKQFITDFSHHLIFQASDRVQPRMFYAPSSLVTRGTGTL